MNPTWRNLDKTIRGNLCNLRKLQAELGRQTLDDKEPCLQKQAELHQDIKQLEATSNNCASSGGKPNGKSV